MNLQFKPMLAATASLEKLRYPLIASPKLDGIRAVVKDKVLLSRSLKPIPNQYVQDMFGRTSFDGLDGELIMGDPSAADVFRATTSAVMSHSGTPDVKLFVFDRHNDGRAYISRTSDKFASEVASCNGEILVLEQQLVQNESELLAYEDQKLMEGYEGIILRNPASHYKYGRSTLTEGSLIKLKRFLDSEAVILDKVLRTVNNNQAEISELGYMKRSHKKAGIVEGDGLGALVVQDAKTKVIFNVGSGFTEEERLRFWDINLIGKLIKYKYFPTGSKDKPRFPTFLGFRSPDDIGD